MVQEPVWRVGARDKQAKIRDAIIQCDAYCPNCDYGPMDGCSGVALTEDDLPPDLKPMPGEGDPTICARCGELLIYTFEHGKLGLRRATRFDEARIAEDEETWHFVQTLSRTIRERYNNGF